MPKHRLRCKVRKDYEVSLNEKCPCTQQGCPIQGNCVLCVQNHIEHKRHIPECIQNILRPAVESLTKQLELQTKDGRPKPSFWKKLDKKAFVKKSFDRHRGKKKR